uniref:NADH-ubiquinone oxidoreductase chain 3 n=1 Tax=Amphipsalta zelandica TaxID=1232797 RepID=A0A3S7MDV4_9HEMI|nr:NADH dehydrogenase subunit 3 [Amphipsalta zelandica]
MYNILIYSIVLMFLLMLLSLLLFFISYKSVKDREKSSPFECGFNPFDSSRIPFSSHFFLIAVIFLIFDVELVIIMPIILVMISLNMVDIYIIMMIFLIILTLGLYHEWYNNMLNWI